jgi:hypothetical protein
MYDYRARLLPTGGRTLEGRAQMAGVVIGAARPVRSCG